MHSVGQQLKNIRLNRRMEIEKLAQLSGVTVETIRAIEENKLDVNVSILARLSDILRCTFAIGDISI